MSWRHASLLPLLIACNRGEAAQPHDRHEHSAPTVAPAPEREPPRRGPPGYAETHLEPDRIKALGITRATVERKSLSRVLRTSGIVTPDETRSAHVHAKVRGFLEGLRVNFVGQRVRRGEALCFVYSQDVVAAELELLAVLDNSRKEPAIGELARAEKAAHDKLLAAARRRLSLWDVPRSEIARLEKTLEPSRTFPLVAPRDGVVTAKAAVDGMFVEPNIELYTIADLSRVWVLADLYEADVPFVRVGDTARVRVEGRAEWIEATIAFLPPTIDQATRTMKARVELDNADRRLSPGAFVSVEATVDLGSGVAVPESAVIRTGKRAIVFVLHPMGGGLHVEPREITLGPRVGDEHRVDAGLAVGETVATGAQFLLDSESRLGASRAAGGDHAHHGH